MPPVSRFLRHLGLVLAVLCVWSRAAGLLHMMLVQHVVCLAHPGEFVHQHGAAISDSHEGVAIGEAHSDEHDHCELAHAGRKDGEQALRTVEPWFELTRAATSSELALVFKEQSDRSALTPLALAPKTSPPSRI